MTSEPNGATGPGEARFHEAALLLAQAIEAESEALSRLDVAQAASLGKVKAEAARRFVEERGALGPELPREASLTLQQLVDAVGRNRALLSRAIAAQKSLIEVIVQPVRNVPTGYCHGPRTGSLIQPAVAFAHSA